MPTENESRKVAKLRLEHDERNRPISWPDPTPEMLADPLFVAVWDCIKRWDIAVPGAYDGICGAYGNHARAIVDAIRRAGGV
jgi:hypothetical protein